MHSLLMYELTVNLVKSEFGCAALIVLDHVIGQGKTLLIQAKVETISRLTAPVNRKDVIHCFRNGSVPKKVLSQFC